MDKRKEKFSGTIETIGRWSLEEEKWTSVEDDAQRRKALSLVHFPIIRELDILRHNIIILIDGSRVEDHCKSGWTMNEKESGIKYIKEAVTHNKLFNVRLISMYMDKDAPINEESKFIANYVDKLSKDDNIGTISLVGHSKGATLIFNAMKFCKEQDAFLKTRVYTVSTPFLGTIFASPKYMYPKMREVVKKRLFFNKISEFASDKLIKFYESISSNSHMDYDIGIDEAVNEDREHLYDPIFIRHMLSEENINAIRKVYKYQNIVTCIESKSLLYSLMEFNLSGVSMCIFKHLVFDENADGFVPLRSQYALDDVTQGEFKSIQLPNSQHDFLRSKRLVNLVIDSVSANLY